MIEIKLKDILLGGSIDVTVNTSEINHAINSYIEKMKKMIKLGVLFKIKFSRQLVYKKRITTLMIYLALINELSYQALPILISKTRVSFVLKFLT